MIDGWQDYVLGAGQLAFAAMLVPAIIDPSTVVPVSTSGPTALLLYVFSYTYSTLGMNRAAWSSAVAAVAWTILLILRAPGGPLV